MKASFPTLNGILYHCFYVRRTRTVWEVTTDGLRLMRRDTSSFDPDIHTHALPVRRFQPIQSAEKLNGDQLHEHCRSQ